MGLKSNRYEAITDISYVMNATGTRGGCVGQYTAGSGAALDQSANEARYLTTSSGYMPLGILLNDVVDLDLTRQHINEHKDEVQKGSKITILKQGWVLTNSINPQCTPSAGDPIFVHQSGLLCDAIVVDQTYPKSIGRFEGTADADGYYKIWVNLPV